MRTGSSAGVKGLADRARAPQFDAGPGWKDLELHYSCGRWLSLFRRFMGIRTGCRLRGA